MTSKRPQTLDNSASLITDLHSKNGSCCRMTHTGIFVLIIYLALTISFYRGPSFLAGQHLLILSIQTGLLPCESWWGNWHPSGKVHQLSWSLLPIGLTYPKLWLRRLWCKEVGRVRLVASWSSSNTGHFEGSRRQGSPGRVWRHHQVSSGQWFQTLPPRLPTSLLAPKPAPPSTPWATLTRVIFWDSLVITWLVHTSNSYFD